MAAIQDMISLDGLFGQQQKMKNLPTLEVHSDIISNNQSIAKRPKLNTNPLRLNLDEQDHNKLNNDTKHTLKHIR